MGTLRLVHVLSSLLSATSHHPQQRPRQIIRPLLLPAMEATTKPWHAAYPAPRAVDLRKLTPAQVLDLLQSADAGSSGQAPTLVLVDLRRNDHEGGTIRGSINLPAQSLYPTIPTLYNMFRAAGIRTVIWYWVLPRPWQPSRRMVR